jgi:hypothetical protein
MLATLLPMKKHLVPTESEHLTFMDRSALKRISSTGSVEKPERDLRVLQKSVVSA